MVNNIQKEPLSEEQLSKIEEIIADEITDYMRENPDDDRHDIFQMVDVVATDLAHNLGNYYVAGQIVLGIPFYIWRRKYPEHYQKLAQVAKEQVITVPIALFDIILDRVFNLFIKPTTEE